MIYLFGTLKLAILILALALLVIKTKPKVRNASVIIIAMLKLVNVAASFSAHNIPRYDKVLLSPQPSFSTAQCAKDINLNKNERCICIMTK